MNSVRTAGVVVAGLLVAVWWGVQPPRHQVDVGGSLKAQEQAQCPANTRLENKLCACPDGTSWTDGQCMQVWSSASRSQVSSL